MPTIVIASNFLAGSLISLLIPAALVICMLAWHFRAFSRVPEGKRGSRTPSDAADPLASVSGGTASEPPPVDSL